MIILSEKLLAPHTDLRGGSAGCCGVKGSRASVLCAAAGELRRGTGSRESFRVRGV